MSLGGAGLIFFAGLSGESASLVQSAQHLVGNLIQLVLVWLGLVSPVTSVQARPQAAVPAPVHFIKRHTPPVVIKADSDSMRLGTYQHRRHYTYLFEGKTTFHNSPCANASVLVRLISGDQTIAKGTVTDANGSYVLEVAVDAADGSPVDWEMEAYTPDFNKVELSGRRIVQQEEEESREPIVVTTPVEFVVSLAK